MNREELLDVLSSDERHWGKVHTSSAHNSGWAFSDNTYTHKLYDPITIDNWNRAKIKPNTIIEIRSLDHLGYIRFLAESCNLTWLNRYEDAFASRSDEWRYITINGDGVMTINRSKIGDAKEIFIEMPPLKDASEALKECDELLKSSGADINVKILTEKLRWESPVFGEIWKPAKNLGEGITENPNDEKNHNINTTVLAEKMRGASPKLTEDFSSDFAPMMRMSVEYPEVSGIKHDQGKHSHYFKDVSDLDEIDVYRVCDLFEVKDESGATQHAIKKLLCSGQRGVKDKRKDIQEAIDTLNRKLEMMTEDRE